MSLIAPSHSVLKEDQDVDLFSVSPELTVAQAAKILDMSEDCIHEFLDDGTITSRLENGARRVQRDSLLEFEARYREMGEAMADITRWAQEMGLYD